MFVLLVVPGAVFFAIGALGKYMHGIICRGICVEPRCMLAADLGELHLKLLVNSDTLASDKTYGSGPPRPF